LQHVKEKDFFKNILPDFKTLLPARKRILKFEIMKLVDEECNEAATSPPPYSDCRSAPCDTEPTQIFIQIHLE
jgi:hypothetical protein